VKKYTDSHEWIEIDNDVGTLGITTYAQKELGEIVYVELPEPGTKVAAGEEVAVLESTKAAADVYSPLSGTITEVNSALVEEPTLINTSAEENGWLCKIALLDPSEEDALLDEPSYQEMVKQ